MAWSVTSRETIQIEGGHVQAVVISDTVANDNDKSFKVSDLFGGEGQLEILGVRIDYLNTSTVGGRSYAVELQDGASAVVFQQEHHHNPPASEDNVLEYYVGGQANVDVGSSKIDRLPHRLYALSDWTVRVYDIANVNAADDILVHIRALLR